MRAILPWVIVSVASAGCGGGFDSGDMRDPGDDSPPIDVSPEVAPAEDEAGADQDAEAEAEASGEQAAAEDEPETSLCMACAGQGECGTVSNACVLNALTGEQFCSVECAGGSCPQGYSCEDLGGGFPPQCVPQAGSCAAVREDPGEDELQGEPDLFAASARCVEIINRYRDEHGLDPLQTRADLHVCASEAAIDDAGTGRPHGHFTETGGCGIASAETEISGMPVALYGSIEGVLEAGLAGMMSEGPGGGHYEAILGPFTEVGCGIEVTPGGLVWAAQDFR